MANFSGEPVAGHWVLKVVDLAGRDVGKFNSWTLHIVPA
jgi:subtilisin-like proprotein convertase family protein